MCIRDRLMFSSSVFLLASRTLDLTRFGGTPDDPVIGDAGRLGADGVSSIFKWLPFSKFSADFFDNVIKMCIRDSTHTHLRHVQYAK